MEIRNKIKNKKIGDNFDLILSTQLSFSITFVVQMIKSHGVPLNLDGVLHGILHHGSLLQIRNV